MHRASRRTGCQRIVGCSVATPRRDASRLYDRIYHFFEFDTIYIHGFKSVIQQILRRKSH